MIEQAFRDEWPRVVASLARRFGDLDIAEESAGGAFLACVATWGTPPPPNPGGRLMTTATGKAIDRLRRESQREAKHAEASMRQPDPEPVHAVEDDQLRLIFTCCHAALAPEARLALTLRLVAGLTVPEIARTFLSSEAAIGQRITRAKAKILAAHIPFVVPNRLEERPPTYSRWSTSSSTTPTSPAAPNCGSTSPTRRSGWPGCCVACCRASPRWPAGSRCC